MKKVKLEALPGIGGGYSIDERDSCFINEGGNA